MRVVSVEPHGFRNLRDAASGLGERITVVHGPNAAGKTNLLEALYFGLTGHSCRASADRDLIAHGEPAARVELALADGRDGDDDHDLLASIGRDGERRRLLDGSTPPGGTAALAGRPPASVFLPDRLALVKGPPSGRRAHIDRFAGALWPSRADLRQRFGRALAQRNALVARVRAGDASADSLETWDEKLAAEAEPLVGSRAESAELLAPLFTTSAGALGLGAEATIRYRPRGPASAAELADELAERRGRDLGRGYTSFGPQLDELAIELDGRPLRRFGSQGQQRIALLALLLSEREAMVAAGRPAPLMLLDDVMSELDAEHRELLVGTLDDAGQAVITATEPDAVPRSVDWASLAMREGRITGPAVSDESRAA